MNSFVLILRAATLKVKGRMSYLSWYDRPGSHKPAVLEARLSAGENPVSRFTGSEEPYRR